MNPFWKRSSLAITSFAAAQLLSAAPAFSASETAAPAPAKHVLLLSVDGLHSVDLKRYVGQHPDSNLAQLRNHGVYYPLTFGSRPSDSFPGLVALITGGSPRLTGVYYDVSYDRRLVAPGGGPGTPRGTVVTYDESIDLDPSELDGGGGIDPAKLPRDPDRGYAPVYPHQFLRVNTVFEVVRAHGGRTAWSDKHPAYDLVNGPSGRGVEDLYNPEIASGPGNGQAWTDSTALTEIYDAFKVQALLNEIDGFDHAGTKPVGVPALFGMNFQAVSVAEKSATGGYLDALATPSPELAGALDSIDVALGRFVQELRTQGILAETAIILTAKHGQSPIDRSKRQIVSADPAAVVNATDPGSVAQFTGDDVGLFWLKDSAKDSAAALALAANQKALGISEVFAGDALRLRFGSPETDSRTPDVVVTTNQGVIYAGSKATKIAEHGGFADDDTNVALLVSQPRLGRVTVSAPVQTTQVAPTILALLGLSADELQAVREEGTQALSGLEP